MSETLSRTPSASLNSTTPNAVASTPTGDIDITSDIDTKNEDRPLRIIAINQDGTSFKLIEPNLQAIMQRVEAINAKKVAIVSVVGAFRTGKSLLLDFFLRYLRHSSKTETKTDDAPKWWETGGDKLTEGNANEDGATPGFLWRPGKDRTTTGIWMYGTPFPRTLPSGETIGVVLMDTQGMFDMKTSLALTAAIFGLSTLISSYQIYNVTKQIQEDYLDQLDYFTQFALVALKEFDKAAARKRKPTDPDLESKKPFQTVEFLVRDWQNFSDDSNITKCIDEMPAVLDAALKQPTKDHNSREQIKNAFETISAFLLPHPGLPMTKLQYKGSIKEIESNFLQLLDMYVRRVLDHQLVVKKIQGRIVSPQSLITYIKTYADVFKEGQVPKPMTLVDAMSMTTNLVAKEEALAQYKADMHLLTGGKSYVPKPDLKDRHDRAYALALDKFDSSAVFGSDSQIAQARSALVKVLDETWENLQKLNEYKLQGDLANFIIPFIAAMLALVLDIFTDYTCDSWSETCQKLSRFSALIYYTVFFLIGMILLKVYRERGAMQVGVGAMGLAQASLVTISDWKDALFKLARHRPDASVTKKTN